MGSRRTRSISGPIVYGSASVALTVALLVGWIYVILKSQELTQQAVGNLWLLVAGILSFTTIMAVLILFSVFLARGILEVRRQTTFVDSVTHELRSPLASLRLCLETLGRSELEDAQREKLRSMMLDDVERLSAFIDDILEASRLEHGSVRGHDFRHVALGPFLERCAATVRRRHHVAEDAIVLDVAPDLQLVTDPPALEVVLKNLLDNAVKYSDPPIEVKVVAAPLGDNLVRIEVIDNGVGIPGRALKRVFERFYRVDEEAVRTRRGTGLGLFVVRAIVGSLGGRLRAHSQGPGQGTCMTVDLPRRKKEPVAAEEPVAGKAYG
jgi:signal transduction histidine kinase